MYKGAAFSKERLRWFFNFSTYGGSCMKLYSIKSNPGDISYFSILNKTESGYFIRICHDREGYEKIREEFLDNNMFELCLRTGYISEVAVEADGVA